MVDINKLTANTEKLTPEFCRKRRLVFLPKTPEEAVFVQRKLFEMGFSWSGGSVSVGCVNDCLMRGMVLDDDGHLYYAPGNKGLLCTSDQFDEPFDPRDIRNSVTPTDQILKEMFNRLSAQNERIIELLEKIRDDLRPPQDIKLPSSTPRP